MKSKRQLRLSEQIAGGVLPLLAVLGLSGCGYHFAASGVALPKTAQTIYVKHFGNTTRYTGINDMFMRYLKDEIENHHRLLLVDEPGRADLTLSGSVARFYTVPIAFNSVLEPTEYEQVISVDASLVDNRTHKILWKGYNVNDAGGFASVPQAMVPTSPQFLAGNLRSSDIAQMPDIQVSGYAQSLAQSRMLKGTAERLYEAMSDGF